jgi:hypothetical protein
MPESATDELEGNALSVYAYVVQVNKPVGVREVTRGANLSSSSVAFRHLQKLESLGLLKKNECGDFVLKEKANVGGHVWVGRNLVPRLMLFAFFFIGAFGAEVSIIFLYYMLNNTFIETSFFFLSGITALSGILFLAEGLSLHKKVNPQKSD